jgi:hypothetical protein
VKGRETKEGRRRREREREGEGRKEGKKMTVRRKEGTDSRANCTAESILEHDWKYTESMLRVRRRAH